MSKLSPFLAVLSILVLPALAQAEPVAGSTDDPAGDAGKPQGDIRTVAVVFDGAAGSLSGAVALAQPPVHPALGVITTSVGTWTKRSGLCRLETYMLEFPPDPAIDEWYGGIDLGREEGPDASIVAQAATVTFDVSWNRVAGKHYNCARLETSTDDGDHFKFTDEVDVFSLTAQEAQRPTAPPHCSAPARRVRQGRKLALHCTNVRGPVTVRIYRSSKLKRTARAKVGRGGRLATSTRGLRKPGRYAVFVWRGADVLGYDDVKVSR
jgi:hypothetical protein